MFFGFMIFGFMFLAMCLAIMYGLLLLAGGRKYFGQIVKWTVIVVSSVAGILWFVNWLTSKTVLSHEDYYGTYVVDRSFFNGYQADWQYNSFRFEIRKDDSIFFHVTNKSKLLRTYKGTVTTTKDRDSKRLILHMEEPRHHILYSNPTTYRRAWSFYLVFYSPKFNNVFFKKGKWKPIES